jgi:anti-sigma factor ChrR (cupin superfamily)
VDPADLHAHGPAAFALGALEETDRLAFAAHRASCDECRRTAVELHETAAQALTRAAGDAPPSRAVRDRTLALADAPRGDVDVTAYTWTEIAPGVRAHEVRNDPARGLRSVLIWADAGAQHATHRHLGEEDILVLKGALADERGVYGPGEICHSRQGEIHAETILPDGECICFAVYYGGGIEPI